MIFSEPPRTAYDLNFRLFDVPVRVHPFFWLAMVLLGTSPRTTPQEALVWVIAAFFSILVHEFGHVVAIRYFGASAHIVLHGFGGLAIQNSHWRRDPKSQIVISLAGPVAGFLFAAVVYLGLRLSGVLTLVKYGFPYVVRVAFAELSPPALDNLIQYLLFANIYWGLLNLLPIYPLDGGQVSASLFQMSDARDGLRKSLILSFATSVLMAVYAFWYGNQFAGFFFGYMAFQNYQLLQQLGGRYTGGSPW